MPHIKMGRVRFKYTKDRVHIHGSFYSEKVNENENEKAGFNIIVSNFYSQDFTISGGTKQKSEEKKKT